MLGGSAKMAAADDDMEVEGLFSAGPAPDSEPPGPEPAADAVARFRGEGKSLLEPPGPDSARAKPLVRPTAECKTLGDRMVVADRGYSQQYAGMYFIRLALLRKRVVNAAQAKWKDLPGGRKPEYVQRVLDIQPNMLCFVVGTVYMDMPEKPNILDEVTAEHYVVAPPPREKYLSDRDVATLEDESGRVTLNPESTALMRKEGLVTGVVCGLLGREGDKGEFEVVDVCFPEWEAGDGVPRGVPGRGERWIALVSGLNVARAGPLVRAEMLCDFLAGGLGVGADQQAAAKIVRTVVAGNSVGRPPALFSGLSMSSSDASQLGRTKRTAAQAAAEEANNPLRILDALLDSLAANMEIDVMPGERDPATYSWPQQPILPALLPKTTRYSETVMLRTNPYECEVEGCRILGTSGQNIDDIFKYVETEDRLRIAENTMDWANIAPTAPDTLFSYPFKSIDPFVLQNLPDLYFVGNQPAFATSVWKGRTRVVLVPDFSKTGEIVLVEVGGRGKVGECCVVRIGTAGFGDGEE
ncbi:DNA polymerase-like protein subunit delta-2 [Hyaloraphidium curvatum]|nr:DNA polymerase-like protein subunit delta-2 [Hyaloraphidium curvatum]